MKKLRLIIYTIGIFFICNHSFAQWKACGNIKGGEFSNVIAHNDTIFAASENSIFKSTDNGSSWVKDQDLPQIFKLNKFIYANNSFIAATNKGLFVYSPTSNSWKPTATLSDNIIDIVDVPIGNSIEMYATNGHLMYRSLNNGLSWALYPKLSRANDSIASIGRFGTKLFIATEKGIFKSNDRNSWSEDTSKILKINDTTKLYGDRNRFIEFSEKGDTLYMGSILDNIKDIDKAQAIFYITKTTEKWVKLNIEMANQNCFKTAYAFSSGHLIVGGCYGNNIFKLNDKHTDFDILPSTNAPRDQVIGISANSDYIFLCFKYRGLYRYDILKQKHDSIDKEINNLEISGIDKIGNKLLIGTQKAGTFVSNNSGDTWEAINTGMQDGTWVENFIDFKDTIHAAVNSHNIWGGVYYLAPDKTIWDTSKNIPYNGYPMPILRAENLQVVGDSLIASTTKAVLFSVNGGPWKSYARDQPSGNMVKQTIVMKGYTFNNVFGQSIYRLTHDPFLNWNDRSSSDQSNINYLRSHGFFLYNFNERLYVGTNEGLYYSDDYAETGFKLSDNGIGRTLIKSMTKIGNNLFAGGDNFVYWSSDNGLSWKLINDGLGNAYVKKLTCDKNYLYAGTLSSSVWRFPIASLYPPILISNKVKSILGNSAIVDVAINTQGFENKVQIDYSINKNFTNISTDTFPYNSSYKELQLSLSLADLKSKTTYYYKVIVTNLAGKSSTSKIDSFTTKSFTKLLLTNHPTELIVQGDQSTIAKAVPEEVKFNVEEYKQGTTVKFFYRGLRNNQWIKAIPEINANNFTVKLMPSYFDELGLEYEIEINPIPGYASGIKSDTSITKRISIKYNSGLEIPVHAGARVEDYNFISFPLKLSNNLKTNILGSILENVDYDPTQWRFLTYNPKDQNYNKIWDNNPIQIMPGRGYWFAVREIKNGRKLNSGVGNSVANDNLFDGYNYSILLDTGFNQIGNPYVFDVPWSAIKVATNNSLVGPLYGFIEDGKTIAYEILNNVQKFKGGYIRNNSNAAINLKVPASIPDFLQKRIKKGNFHESVPMALKFIVESGNRKMALTGLEINNNASMSYDHFDEIAPPMQGFPTLTFKEQSNVVKNVQPEKSEGQYWEFEINGLVSETVTRLQWEISKEENNKKLILHDLSNNKIIDMQNVSIYSFSTKGKFKVYYGGDSYLKKNVLPEIINLTVYPSPASTKATISFTLPENFPNKYLIKISLLDIYGKNLETIVEDEYCAGFHTLALPINHYYNGFNLIELTVKLSGKIQKFYSKIIFN